MNEEKYYLYFIGNEEDIKLKNYNNGYIGVTNFPLCRWKSHKSYKKSKVSKAINEFNWIFEKNFTILYETTNKKECFKLEKFYRNKSNIGLNIAKGGLGGYTKYTKERNKKISKSHAGKILTKIHRENIKKSKIGLYECEKNPNAKKWKLISPQNQEFDIVGNLIEFCETKNICKTVLYKHLDNKVPNISTKCRFKNEKEMIMRENTTGWILKRRD